MAARRVAAPHDSSAAHPPSIAPRVLQRGLPPVLAPDTRVLILGSFPGVASLAARQYYAHPRNHFWPLLAALVGEPLPVLPYPVRLARLQAHRIGLWDTIVACKRDGSLDANIRDETRAEVDRVRRTSLAVALVCFNGKTAARAQPAWHEAGYATAALPSSSPAYTRPFAEKLDAWRALADYLEVSDPCATGDPSSSSCASRPPPRELRFRRRNG